MILGCGVDLVEVARLRRVLRRQGRTFLARIFTPEERRYCVAKRLSAEHLAARFAAKEAVAKAFGDRQGLTMRWQDVAVVRAPSGQPQVQLTGPARRLQRRRRVRRIHLSLTHTAHYAVAMAVLEGRGA